MASTFWSKQTKEPLFPDLLWSRPENRASAGKLLIVGGNAHGFNSPAEAYSYAQKAGVGTARVLLPDVLQKTIGRVLENGEFAPSTPSGSFAKSALADMIDHSSWADGLLLAGDFGRNSETAILLENFLSKTSRAVTLTKDSVDYFLNNASVLLNRPETTLVITVAELQKLLQSIGSKTAVKLSMDLIQLVEAVHETTLQHPAALIIKQNEYIIVAKQGSITTTKIVHADEAWQIKTAAYASVWWLQNPGKTFEALTTSVYESSK